MLAAVARDLVVSDHIVVPAQPLASSCSGSGPAVILDPVGCPLLLPGPFVEGSWFNISSSSHRVENSTSLWLPGSPT